MIFPKDRTSPYITHSYGSNFCLMPCFAITLAASSVILSCVTNRFKNRESIRFVGSMRPDLLLAWPHIYILTKTGSCTQVVSPNHKRRKICKHATRHPIDPPIFDNFIPEIVEYHAILNPPVPNDSGSQDIKQTASRWEWIQ